MTAWAIARGRTDLEGILDRLALALLTESSGGFIYANDGAAYGPGTHPELSDEVRQRVYGVLRASLELPHDRVGHDGRSTGPLQQISTEAVAALSPNGINWGWGSMTDTMLPDKAAVAFVARLKVTGNGAFISPTGAIIRTDPIVADVLRTQQPVVGSTLPWNYRPEQVELAKRIARGGPRFFTNGGK